MRMKSPVTYIILLTLVCFAAGVLSVVIRPDKFPALLESVKITEVTEATEAPPALPSEAAGNGDITILILGVDHIADPEGKLLAVWFVTFRPHDKQLTLLGLPTDLPIAEDQPSLGDVFDLWLPPEYGASFIHDLSAYAPSPIRGFAVLDEHGFAVLVDYLGGVDIDDQYLDGTSVIGSLRLMYQNPQVALKLQARILEGLRTRVKSIGTTPELTVLTSLAPIHAYTSPSPPELATMAIPLLPLDPGWITIHTWPFPP